MPPVFRAKEDIFSMFTEIKVQCFLFGYDLDRKAVGFGKKSAVSSVEGA